MTAMPIDLSKILTASLYEDVLDARFPWDGPIDIAFASQFFFGTAVHGITELYEIIYDDALKPISTMVPTIPDLTKYLPSSTSPEFPKHALAIFMLCDQGPRLLLEGMNARYTNGYFDTMTVQFIKTLIKRGDLPDETARWQALGYGFEDAIFRKVWLYVPLIHSEDLTNHNLVQGRLEILRKEIENHTRSRDPYRDTMAADRQDLTLFPKLLKAGPPSTFGPFFFWFLRVMTAHYPIIKKFGRYPYRNDNLGRITTEEEKQFLKDTENFGKPNLSHDQILKLREQVKAGVWERLRDDDVRRRDP